MRPLNSLIAALATAVGLVLPVKAGAQEWHYTNPVLHMDFSDPDVCQADGAYYMTASSFNFFPGLPILKSTDLVHWKQVGAALTDYPQPLGHGEGIWAPSIRYHDGWFYIFAADPDRGIFMVRTQDPEGKWEPPVWVVRQKGFIDPCPLWDDDTGQAWLSHAAAGSRAGLKSVLFIAPLSQDGTRLTGPSSIVFDGHLTQPTIEGTKLYKHNGRYYLFAPAGGVATGWQTVLRADEIMGPWEEKVVMAWAQGTVNGPHQGAWVKDKAGADWFLHFQDKGAYGRIVHLQPMQWKANGWPVIGEDPDGDGVGQPVKAWTAPAGWDEGPYSLPSQWEFPAIPSPYWRYDLKDGGLRLYSVEQSGQGLWNCGNIIQQKFPAERFIVSAKLTFRPNPQLKEHGEKAGFVVMGNDYAGLTLTDTGSLAKLSFISCKAASKGAEEEVEEICDIGYKHLKINNLYNSKNIPEVRYPDIPEATLWVKMELRPKEVEGNVPDAICRFYYSTDGIVYQRAGKNFTAKPDMWTGAKFGFFCNRYSKKNDAGCLDITDILVKPEFAPLDGFYYEEAMVPQYILPDPLQYPDGKMVTSAKEWESKRRKQVLHLLEEEYGTVPPRPEGLSWRIKGESPYLDGSVTKRDITIYLDKAARDSINLVVFLPKTSAKRTDKGLPCFLGVNFFGNNTIDKEQAHRWPIAEITSRGYAVATFCCEDLAPDNDLSLGIRARYPEYTWGHLAAWGWGLSRALDYFLEGDPDIDGKRIAVFGHSRMGKAAVWAGARDTRFAMVISNASGCGGAAISRRRFGETIRRINTHFPYWFASSFHKYNDNEAMMPFDQHEVLALIAPRPLFVESGTEDRWSDPEGEKQGLEAALPVYKLYGAESVTGYGIRPGKHEILLEDWLHYLSFADLHL